MSSSIDSLVNREYQYGFVTDVEADTHATWSERRRHSSHLEEEGRARSGCSIGGSRRIAGG